MLCQIRRRMTSSKASTHTCRSNKLAARSLQYHLMPGARRRVWTTSLTVFEAKAKSDLFLCSSCLVFPRHALAPTSCPAISPARQRLESLLEDADAQLAGRLNAQGVCTKLYGMRWITLLLSQEFRLPDVLRLWDSIFAQDEDQRMPFLLHICCAMVLRIKDELMEGDFSDNLQRLQSYPRDFDVEELVTAQVCLSPVFSRPSLTLYDRSFLSSPIQVWAAKQLEGLLLCPSP